MGREGGIEFVSQLFDEYPGSRIRDGEHSVFSNEVLVIYIYNHSFCHLFGYKGNLYIFP